MYIIPYRNHQIITLSDLECDYINARSCCSKLNKVRHCLAIQCNVVARTAVFYSILDHGIMLDLILNIVSYYACFWSCLHEADCSVFCARTATSHSWSKCSVCLLLSERSFLCGLWGNMDLVS